MGVFNTKLRKTIKKFLADKGDVFSNFETININLDEYDQASLFLDQQNTDEDFDELIEYISELLVGFNIYSYRNKKYKTFVDYFESPTYDEITSYINTKLQEINPLDEDKLIKSAIFQEYAALCYSMFLSYKDIANGQEIEILKSRFDFIKNLVCQKRSFSNSNDDGLLVLYSEWIFDEGIFDNLWGNYDNDYDNYYQNKKQK